MFSIQNNTFKYCAYFRHVTFDRFEDYPCYFLGHAHRFYTWINNLWNRLLAERPVERKTIIWHSYSKNMSTLGQAHCETRELLSLYPRGDATNKSVTLVQCWAQYLTSFVAALIVCCILGAHIPHPYMTSPTISRSINRVQVVSADAYINSLVQKCTKLFDIWDLHHMHWVMLTYCL